MIDLEISNKLTPEKGRLLISEPFLDDDYFKRSVVFLCEHNNDGSFGFVLNNYLNISIQDVLPEFPEIGSRISLGGPVKPENLYFLHTVGNRIEGSIPVMDGIYMGGEFEDLKELVISGEIKDDDLRFFVGYSGWEPKQLDNELEKKAWLIVKADAKDVMDTSLDKLWSETLKQQGKKYEIMSKFPEDPSLN